MTDKNSATTELSFTRISKFLQCPALYKYIYIDGKERPDNQALEYGRKIHNLIQRLSLEVILDEEGNKRDTDPNEIQEWFNEIKGDYEFLEPEKEYWRLVRVAEYLQAQDFGRDDVEKKLHADTPEAPLVGTLDNLHFHDDGTVVILDYKTSRQTIDAAEIEADLQLNIYAYLISKIYKDIPNLRIKIGVWFWRYGGHELVDWENQNFEETLNKKVSECVNATDFPYKINQYCGFCPMLSTCGAKDDLPNKTYGSCKDREKYWKAKAGECRKPVEDKFDVIEGDAFEEDGYRYKMTEEDASEVDNKAMFEMILPDFESVIIALKNLKDKFEESNPQYAAEFEHALEKFRDYDKAVETLTAIVKPVKKEAKALGIDLPVGETKKKFKLSYKALTNG